MAGLELAAELEARGVDRVVVLEGGAPADLRHVNASHSDQHALRLWLEPETDACFRQSWTSLAPPHYTGASGLRARVGGRSLYWYGVSLPIEPGALTPQWWPDEVISDLRDSWDGGAPLYDRLRESLHRWRGRGLPSLIDSDVQIALGDIVMSRTPRAIRPSTSHPGRWFAYSPLDRWRDPDNGRLIATSEHIAIYAGQQVHEVMIEGGHARGVSIVEAGDNRVREVAADHVVLAAGTVECSRLALQALAAASTTASSRLDGLMDHIVQGVFVRIDSTDAAPLLELLPIGSYWMPCPDARSNLFVDVSDMDDGNHVLLDIQLTGEQMPSIDNYVECARGAGPRVAPVVNAKLSDADGTVIVEQQRIIADLWSVLAEGGIVRDRQLEFVDYGTTARTNAVVLAESIGAVPSGAPTTWCNCLGTEDHEGGTIALGRMLNDDHELNQVPGLFAAGPSSFPRMGAANPALTTLALAHRLAARLA
jgi:choline dehydrogenase-like flavoprotein